MLLGVILFALLWTNGLPQWLDAWLADYFLVAFAVMVGAIIALGAYLAGVARFYAYAVLVFAAFAVSQWLNTPDGLPVGSEMERVSWEDEWRAAISKTTPLRNSCAAHVSVGYSSSSGASR